MNSHAFPDTSGATLVELRRVKPVVQYMHKRMALVPTITTRSSRAGRVTEISGLLSSLLGPNEGGSKVVFNRSSAVTVPIVDSVVARLNPIADLFKEAAGASNEDGKLAVLERVISSLAQLSSDISAVCATPETRIRRAGAPGQPDPAADLPQFADIQGVISAATELQISFDQAVAENDWAKVVAVEDHVLLLLDAIAVAHKQEIVSEGAAKQASDLRYFLCRQLSRFGRSANQARWEGWRQACAELGILVVYLTVADDVEASAACLGYFEEVQIKKLARVRSAISLCTNLERNSVEAARARLEQLLPEFRSFVGTASESMAEVHGATAYCLRRPVREEVTVVTEDLANDLQALLGEGDDQFRTGIPTFVKKVNDLFQRLGIKKSFKRPAPGAAQNLHAGVVSGLPQLKADAPKTAGRRVAPNIDFSHLTQSRFLLPSVSTFIEIQGLLLRGARTADQEDRALARLLDALSMALAPAHLRDLIWAITFKGMGAQELFPTEVSLGLTAARSAAQAAVEGPATSRGRALAEIGNKLIALASWSGVEEGKLDELNPQGLPVYAVVYSDNGPDGPWFVCTDESKPFEKKTGRLYKLLTAIERSPVVA